MQIANTVMAELPYQRYDGSPDRAEQPLQDSLLAERINFWRREFSLINPATHDVVELRQDAEEDLQQHWDSDQLCAYRGFAMVVRAGGRRIPTDIDYQVGKSADMRIAKFGEPGHEGWVVSYAFSTIDPLSSPTEPREQMVYLAATDTSVVVPYRSVDAVIEALPLRQEILSQKSDNLAALLNTKKFFNLRLEGQVNKIKGALEDAETAAEMCGGIWGSPISLEAEYVYVTSASSDTSFQRISTDDHILAGTCEGLDVLGLRRVMSKRRIRRPEHLVDPDAGLFLVIVPSEVTRYHVGIEASSNAYVPISGQDVGALFSSMADADESLR
ncbi:MAG: hypothetical protein JWM81_192 [Candidatus Saccharibacteria bacterium]|nr:hypothetical protein [Candidatus Saccharibacteria bacterium]